MSALRDVRLLIAKSLEVSPSVKASVLNLMNALDLHIDENGIENSELIEKLLSELEDAIINEEADEFMDTDDVRILDLDEDDVLLEDDDDSQRS